MGYSLVNIQDKMKTLCLIRHAHAVSDAPADAGDHGRILSPDGLREAENLAAHLGTILRPDIVIASTAERTRHTAEILFSGLEKRAEHKLYLADALHIADEIKALDDAHATVALIGHNPGMGELAMQLSNLKINTFPTAACAIFTCGSQSWREFDRDIRLRDFLTA